MMLRGWLLAGLLIALPGWAAERDGEIVASSPCAARPQQSYGEYVKQAKRRGKGDVQAAVEEDFKAKAPPRPSLRPTD